MAIINNIKQKIRILDQGSFQNLCDQILSNMGYDNLVSLGSQAGTQKTTKGTPDTYCIVDKDKYIFVEYTTQDKKIFKKIKSDIDKCLDKKITGIEISKITEILYFHTSSNLSPKQDNEIKTLGRQNGVAILIYGIDWIAFNLYRQNRALAKEYLNIQIDNNQIFEVNDFIKQNSISNLAAPLDNEFMFRSEELNTIDDIFQKQDMVVLVGRAGAGKTRLAVEYAKKRVKKSREKIFCIRDNALPIYEDLNFYIGSPGDYFLVVDDANQIAGLSHILYYLTQKSKDINVKILITVRDYALIDIRSKITEYTTFNPVMIKLFSDDEIIEIVKSAIGIKNQLCLDRIAEISNGNARIAMIAGKTVMQEKTITSLSDVSTLYESYYGNAIKRVGLSDDKDFLVTFGITAFINSFRIDMLDYLDSVFEASNISKDDFMECIYQLNSFELVDICNDKAVKISEQCLSNYILKFVFYDKKLINLAEMIKAYFPINQSRTISSVNVLTNVFYSDQMITFVKNAIRKIWDDLSKIDSDRFFEFVKAFYPINETATLQIIKQRIKNVETIAFDENIVKVDCCSYDDIINILGGFYRCDNYSLAIELFLLYYKKRPNLYNRFLETIKQYYIINKYSEYNNFQIEKELLHLISKYSNGWTDNAISYLFMDVAKLMLSFRFERFESNSDHSFAFSYVNIHSGESIVEWRSLVWKYLFDSRNNSYFKKCFHSLLRNYGSDSDSDCSAIIQADCFGIYKIFSEYMKKENLADCIVVDRFVSFLRKHDLSEYIKREIVDDFLASEQLNIYKTLIGTPAYEYKHYNEEIIERKQKIKFLIDNSDFSMIYCIINISKNQFYGEEYRVSKGLEILFETLFESNNHFIEAIQYYLLSDTPQNVFAGIIIQRLFQLLNDKEVFDLISLPEYKQKNEWLYFYYYFFPAERVTQETLNSFYEYLSDDADKYIQSSGYRRIGFIKKFVSVDKCAFITSCKIILNKKSYFPFIVDIYFNLLFHNQVISVEEVLDLFSNERALLEDIYLFETLYQHYFDNDETYFLLLLKSDSRFAYRFFETVITQPKRFSILDYKRQIQRIYEFDDYQVVFEKFASMIVERFDYYLIELKNLFEILVTYQNKKMSDCLIKTFIDCHFDDEKVMYCLFEAIAEMSDGERINYIKAFLNNTLSIDAFKNLPIVSNGYSWSGSEVPVIEKQKEFIAKVNKELHGIEYLDHKRYLEEREERLEEYIKEVQIREYLSGY